MFYTELTRENILYQLRGLSMTLRYQRDALMCTFMDIIMIIIGSHRMPRFFGGHTISDGPIL